MIPIKIQIKNFLSYGDDLQVIDFSPYHLVCLSGKNGHGKSALLDAITWAIWGQARKIAGTTKADEGLLRLGQKHMLVILDFLCNDNHYRVRREFALTYGKPYAALDFGIIKTNEDTILPLTEKTIRGTQQKIENTLRLDYDSFINSAFLRQGSANEFSKKSPKDRKEILANILGLQRYEQLRKAAHDIVRNKQNEQQQLSALAQKTGIELNKQDEVNRSLHTTQQQIIAHNLQEESFVEHYKKLRAEQHALVTLKHEEAALQKELKQLALEYTKLVEFLHTTMSTWRMIHKQQLNVGSSHQLKQQKTALQHMLEQTQQKLQQKLESKEAYLQTQQKMVLLEQKLKQEQTSIIQQKQEHVHSLQLQAKQLEQQISSYQEQHDIETKEVHELATMITALQEKMPTLTTESAIAMEQQFEKRRTHYQYWIAQANMIKTELNQAEQKRLLVDDTSPSCPLCEQNLSATRKRFLKQKLSKNEQSFMHRYQRLSKLIHTIKNLLIKQHEELNALKQKQSEYVVEQHKLKVAQDRIEKLKQTLTAREHEQLRVQHLYIEQQKAIQIYEAEIKQIIETAQQHIEKNDSYRELSMQLQQAHMAYNNILYDQAEHKNIQEQLNSLEQQLSHYSNIEQEALLQEERKKQITSSCNNLKMLKHKQRSTMYNLEQYRTINERETVYMQQEKQLEEQRLLHRKQQEELLQEKGRLEQQQQYLKLLAEEYEKQQQYIETLHKEIADYQEIAHVCSKNGIQALLIEDAIPEIEQEANELLSRLTDNQATILIESLRDLKSGGTKETLDIKIADTAGIRSYEMFSGGEAFRIDFSLRIAISKLLARRAGTSLQTLIIDEGFGSQDDEGLSYIMDALYKIQDDFKKVIIVSHLPRMKDQFPVHFYINKNAHGSFVTIIEQA